MSLRDVIEGFVPLLVGCGAGLAAFVVLSVAELIGKVRCDRSLRLERYRAEQSLHDIRRDAIHDMLETARTQRDAYDGDVIDGTCVEVRQ
jgi:hypothetical protein